MLVGSRHNLQSPVPVDVVIGAKFGTGATGSPTTTKALYKAANISHFASIF